MTSPDTPHSAQDIERMQRTREELDAKFLSDGARLVLSDEQLAEMRQLAEEEDQRRALGQVVLYPHDPELAEVLLTPAQRARKETHLKAFHERVDQIAEPYAGMYMNCVPSTEVHKGFSIGAVLRAVATKQPLPDTSMTIGHLDAKLESFVRYAHGEKYNHLESAEVVIKREVPLRHVAELSPKLRTSYDYGVLTTVDFLNLSPRSELFEAAFVMPEGEPPNRFGEFVRGVTSLYGEIYSVQMDVTGEAPFITVSGRSGQICAYVYNAVADRFNRRGTKEITDDPPGSQRERPDFLTARQVYGILTDALGVIPVTETEIG